MNALGGRPNALGRITLVDCLAVHRLTRLATEDTITAPLRDSVIAVAYRRAGRPGGPELEMDDADPDWTEVALADEDAPPLAKLLTCKYCASIWVAAGVVLVRRYRWWAPVRNLLAMSSVSVFLTKLEP